MDELDKLIQHIDKMLIDAYQQSVPYPVILDTGMPALMYQGTVYLLNGGGL